jgi:hypothetical protein
MVDAVEMNKKVRYTADWNQILEDIHYVANELNIIRAAVQQLECVIKRIAIWVKQTLFAFD